MSKAHVFNSENDSEKLAFDLIRFLKRWGLWKEVQIFTHGKCYSDGTEGEIKIRDEDCPENYLKGFTGLDCIGKSEWQKFSNTERLLDMTFEGPLCLLLRHQEYEVRVSDVSEEVKHMIMSENTDLQDEITELIAEALDGKTGWDPVECDSYEEWLELNDYCDVEDISVSEKDMKGISTEFSSKEEYEDFLLRIASIRQSKIMEYFDEKLCADAEYSCKTFYDDGRIANQALTEFNNLLEKYGLWYELGFAWSLTTYRI